MFKLYIRTDGAAFRDEPARLELARLLRELARRIKDGEPVPVIIRDLNGNTVGRAWTEGKP